MTFKRISLFLALILVLMSIVGCQNRMSEPKTKSIYGLFDSFVTVSSYTDDDTDTFEGNCAAVSNLLGYYNKLFDIYNEYEDINNLRTVNKNAGKKPVKVDRELIDFIEYAIDICKKCDLEINIAMGSVLKIWHDARVAANENGIPYLPSKKELEDAYVHTEIDSIDVDRENSTIFISDPQTLIDVGAIAKGYAAMKASELLRSRDADGYILNLGGNIIAIGTKNNGDGWITGITNPNRESDERFVARIEICNTSCVTSGDYERYFSFEGKEYHHIIDKDTLEPSTHYRSVTVLCYDSALADALSTALFCMPIEDGKDLIKSFEGVEVIWILPDNSIEETDGIEILAQ